MIRAIGSQTIIRLIGNLITDRVMGLLIMTDSTTREITRIGLTGHRAIAKIISDRMITGTISDRQMDQLMTPDSKTPKVEDIGPIDISRAIGRAIVTTMSCSQNIDQNINSMIDNQDITGHLMALIIGSQII